MKTSNDIIGNRTRDLPVFSAVPQLALYETVYTKEQQMVYDEYPSTSCIIPLTGQSEYGF